MDHNFLEIRSSSKLKQFIQFNHMQIKLVGANVLGTIII